MAEDALAQAALTQLLQVMRRLRDPVAGCAWDVAQTSATIAPYTLEEAYEVADAIERGDLPALRDELGDLLFQVVFHARMAEEAGHFAFADIANGISDKLRRRHPQVFAAAQHADWEALKADERVAQGNTGVLAGVALALPALARATKLGKRAARVNFDWQIPAQVRGKVAEELAELDEAVAQNEGQARIAEELGDLLFALAQWARHQHIDPEGALRGANAKFERRFAAMEQAIAHRQGAAEPLVAKQLNSAQWEALWHLAKAGKGVD